MWLFVASLLCTPIACYVAMLMWLHRKYSSIPGPPRSSFIFGNLSEIVKAGKRGIYFDQLVLDWQLQYGYTITFSILHKMMVITCDPEILKIILLEHPRSFPKGSMYKRVGYMYSERGTGDGLVTETDYNKWLTQRNVLNPAFQRKYLAGLVADFNTVADNLVHELHSFAGTNSAVDMLKYFHYSTLDVIAKTAFGLAINSIRETNPLTAAVSGLLEGYSSSFLSAFPNWSPFLYNERNAFRKNLGIIKTIARNSINDRLQAIKRDDVIPDDVLSVMVKAHVDDPTFSIDLILDNMVTFFIAGEETSANTLSFAVMELGRHPEVLDRLRQEVDDCIGNKPHIAYEDVSRLKYCGCIIKESLRMYPIVGATVRHIPVAVDFKDMHIPAGVDVMCSMFSSSRHPDLIDNPLKFNPDRFDTRNHERVSQLSYFPFSLGPRSCIGQNFAMMEMKIVLVKFLQHFNFTLDTSQSFAVKKTGTLHPVHVLTILTDR